MCGKYLQNCTKQIGKLRLNNGVLRIVCSDKILLGNIRSIKHIQNGIQLIMSISGNIFIFSNSAASRCDVTNVRIIAHHKCHNRNVVENVISLICHIITVWRKLLCKSFVMSSTLHWRQNAWFLRLFYSATKCTPCSVVTVIFHGTGWQFGMWKLRLCYCVVIFFWILNHFAIGVLIHTTKR